MELLVFVIASAMVLAGAGAVILMRNPVHAALGLVLTLFGVAVHFVAMEAHFLAAVQVIVYAGAIVVLFLFVIMLLGVDTADNLRVDPIRIQRPLAAVVGVAIVALMITAIVSTRELGPLPPTDAPATPRPTTAQDPDANVQDLAHSIFSTHVFSFELTSILLVVAVAGTVVLTRRQRGTGERTSS